MPTPEYHNRDSIRLASHHTRDSISTLIKDSMTIHFAAASSSPECPPDTITVERWRTETREHWHEAAKADTITIRETDSIFVPYPVEKIIEVEKPIPRYFLITSLLFWLLFIINAAIIVRKVA